MFEIPIFSIRGNSSSELKLLFKYFSSEPSEILVIGLIKSEDVTT